MITDVNIDPAGDVWVANNWNSVDGVPAETQYSQLPLGAVGQA
jgi:hypothetical protein